jgi:AcrR family transcriptional regulator
MATRRPAPSVPAHAAAAAPLGQREINKLEKLGRIRAAARELFAKHGYAAATMRDIAKQAHVGLGTLFSYADDKRDLVFLIFNEELEATTTRALAAPRPDQPVLDQLMAMFAVHYEQFAVNPALSRLALQELTFYGTGKQAGTFQSIRNRLLEGIHAVIVRAQADGRVRARPDADTIARLLFFEYSAAVRWWIATPVPDPRQGVDDLRALLAVMFEGLAPQASPHAASDAGRGTLAGPRSRAA